MERIKEALERARAERHDSAQPSSGADSTAQPVAASTLLGQGIQVTAAPRQTPSVTLDPLHLERHRIVAHNKVSAHAGAFDLLRTQVLQRMNRHGWRTIGVVSPAPGAGKTVVSINLAMGIAQLADRTAMLVDFDLRRPSILRYLGVERSPTLTDYFAGECEFADVLFNPALPSLVVAGAANYVPNSAELLGSARMSALINEVKGRYQDRIAVFDLPPLLNADDALAVLPSIDCVLMVVANGLSTRQEVEDAMRYLSSTQLIGTVLNKAADSADGYGYSGYGVQTEV